MKKIISFLLIWSVCFQLNGARTRLPFQFTGKSSSQTERTLSLFINGLSGLGYYTAAKKIDQKPLNGMDYVSLVIAPPLLGYAYGAINSPKLPRLVAASYGFTLGALSLFHRYTEKNK